MTLELILKMRLYRVHRARAPALQAVVIENFPMSTASAEIQPIPVPVFDRRQGQPKQNYAKCLLRRGNQHLAWFHGHNCHRACIMLCCLTWGNIQYALKLARYSCNGFSPDC